MDRKNYANGGKRRVTLAESPKNLRKSEIHARIEILRKSCTAHQAEKQINDCNGVLQSVQSFGNRRKGLDDTGRGCLLSSHVTHSSSCEERI